MVQWADLNKQDGVVAIDQTGNAVFDVMVDGSTLRVSGTSAGERVAVYSLNGAQVLAATAADGATAVDVAALPEGVYVVVTAAGARKFVK